jgi:isoquinoline 1-oxidoreductase
LACGTEKGSFVAACVEVAVNPAKGEIKCSAYCQAFECGKTQPTEPALAEKEGAS